MTGLADRRRDNPELIGRRNVGPLLLSGAGLDTRENFHNYKNPLRAICFTDDPWATRTAVELLCSGFTATTPDIVSISPKDIGVKKIGHMGFFRPEHRDTLWRGAAEWLQTEQ